MDWHLPDGVTRLVLVRHAEPVQEMAGRCYGRLDIGLSERGLRQAERAGAYLSEVPIEALFSSPLLRARQTTDAVRGKRPLTPTFVDDFRELDFGALEGLRYSEIAEHHPDVYARWMERPHDVTFPGGESYAQLRARVLGALALVRRAHAGKTVCLVSHGGVNRAILADALGLPDTSIFRLDQSYGAVSVIDYWGDAPHVRLMNVCPAPDVERQPDSRR